MIKVFVKIKMIVRT